MTRTIDLMIVGAQKAGTSSLKQYLGEHPEVASHEGEVTYFVMDEEYERGWDRAYEFYYGSRGDAARAILAKSVIVMCRAEAVERLRQHRPDAHVAVVLRNPIERAYSAYWYCRRRGWEDLETFEAALDAEPARAVAGGVRYLHTAYTHWGQYAEQVARLRQAFGEERVHAYLFEDLVADPGTICRQLFRAMGVSEDFTPDVARHHNTSAIARSDTLARLLAGTNRAREAFKWLVPRRARFRIKRTLRNLNERDFRPPAMGTETRQRLVETFRASNTALGTMLGRDLSAWGG